jgi:hypothetical protein
MRWRVLAFVSLGLNLALAAGLWTRSAKSRSMAATDGAEPAVSNVVVRTNVIVRRQFFSWKEVESSDYPTYVANLRDIGCPEQTIRDIIIADVNGLYSRKRAEFITPEQQWWRSEPDSEVAQAAAFRGRELEDERRSLLNRLLGTNWEAGDIVSLPRPSRPGIILDGGVLGALPAETKQAIQEVNLRSQDRLQDYLSSVQKQGGAPDPAELAKLRQETRTELERLMTPPQLEEYLLRYSQNANNLRATFGQLQYFSPTPDEFRGVFRATDTFDQQLQLLASATDPNSLTQRKNLLDARENAIKNALGPQRYQEYHALQDPIYRDSVAQAAEAGTPEAVKAIYEINLATEGELQRIATNASLSLAQKQVAIKQVELQQLQANTVASGQDLPPEEQRPAQNNPPPRTYSVRMGENEAVIALIYGLPVNAIRAANPNVNFARLRAGDTLIIPPVSAPAAIP